MVHTILFSIVLFCVWLSMHRYSIQVEYLWSVIVVGPQLHTNSVSVLGRGCLGIEEEVYIFSVYHPLHVVYVTTANH